MRSLHLNYDIYKLLRWAYRGGNTHANRYYSGYTVDNVLSYDRSSSYPDVMVNCKFPLHPFRPMIDRSIDQIRATAKKGYALLMKVCVWNIRLKDQFAGIPYISISKIISSGTIKSWLTDHPTAQYITDNGRLLMLTEAPVLMALTDIDLKIISQQYDMEHIEVLESYCARYEYLPDEFRQLIISLYKDKTSLKGKDDEESVTRYILSKSRINCAYGMFAQACDNIPWIYNAATKEFIKDPNCYDSETGTVIESSMECVYNDFIMKSLMPYQIGVWVSAWARLRLQEMIDVCGDKIVYVDTDSVKFIADKKISFEKYNNKRIKADLKSGAYADDIKGVTHYMGVAECETDDPIEFKTLGAKKYLYRDAKGYHLTVAGVDKKKGCTEITNAGGFDAFENDFVFREGGGLDVKYNDNVDYWTEYDGHRIHVTDNAYLYQSTYRVGQTDDYKHLIKNLRDVEYLITLDRHFSLI